MKTVTMVIFSLSILIIGGAVRNNIEFNQNCGGYLERAANSNSPELAKTQLKKALDYIEGNNLTSGYTSVLWKTPMEDVGYWYSNIKQAYNEIDSLPITASPLEKSNVLIKLRESLIEHNKNGEELTTPRGISRFPNNGIWGIALWFAIIGILWSFSYFSYKLND